MKIVFNGYKEFVMQFSLSSILRSTCLAAGLMVAGPIMTGVSLYWPAAHASPAISYKTATVDGLSIFYRESGPKDAPVVLLLHGLPASSHMFRELIPILAERYHVLAPDYPGFGQSAQPSVSAFPYTFEAIANLVDHFTQAVGVSRYTLYMQDYGGPVGFRLAVKHPDRVQGLIVQNAVASADSWNPDVVKNFMPFWKDRRPETEKPVRAILDAAGTKFQYVTGATRSERLSPDAWIIDQAVLDRPGNQDVQAEILFNYQDNFAQYPTWLAYLKSRQPPMLIAWGKNDPIFEVKAVDYFKAALPMAEVHLYDAGHFALETHADEIGKEALSFLDRVNRSNR